LQQRTSYVTGRQYPQDSLSTHDEHVERLQEYKATLLQRRLLSCH